MAYSPNVDYRDEARKAAVRHGLSPSIFERQIGVESVNYDPAVISGRRSSPKGAQGIAQIMPATAKAWGVDPLHPVQALNAAAEKMAAYVRKYGSYDKALRAYNAGEGGIQASYGYSETNNYVREILRGHDPGRLSAPVRGPGGGSGAGGGNALQTPAQGGQGANLGQGSTVTAALAAALQAGAAAPARPAATGPALPAFAAAPAFAGPAAPSGGAPMSSRPDVKSLLSAVMASGDQTQVPGGGAQAGGQQPAAGGGQPTRIGRTLVVGDSLGAGTLPQLQKLLGGRVTGDVKVGRASPEGVKVLARELQGGNFQNIVFDQGTNDSSARELRASLARVRRLAPNARILIPTLNGPFATKAKNEVLHQFAASDPNVQLVPWHQLSQQGLLGPDGTHATPAGYAARARQIARTLGWAPAAAPSGRTGRVIVSPGANRSGVPLSPAVTDLVGAIAGAWGKPLTIGTGSNHNQFVQGRPGVQSDHWTGHAADIPASGSTLTRLGQTALVVAGMSPAAARKAKGGVYNLTVNGRRVQIIFNTNEGGNHYNHLHVGVR